MFHSEAWTQVVAIVGSGAGVAIAAALMKLAINVGRLEQKVNDLPCRTGALCAPKRVEWTPLERRRETGHR
ncbi:MAG: hypothetical protein ACLQBX_15875 [Candidatus Limnocylindrales bacterium]